MQKVQTRPNRKRICWCRRRRRRRRRNRCRAFWRIIRTPLTCVTWRTPESSTWSATRWGSSRRNWTKKLLPRRCTASPRRKWWKVRLVHISSFFMRSSVTHSPVSDDYYLVYYTPNNNWYRGKAISVTQPTNEHDGVIVLIYYVDYGNTEYVPLNRLKIMPQQLKIEPPMVLKCRLYECTPKKGTWCKASTKLMLDVLKK